MEHLIQFEDQDAYNKIDFHQTCDKMPIVSMYMIYKILQLTPSRTKIVLLRQSFDCLVNSDASFVMKSISTSLSVLQVVNATHTSPSEDMAVIMLIF